MYRTGYAEECPEQRATEVRVAEFIMEMKKHEIIKELEFGFQYISRHKEPMLVITMKKKHWRCYEFFLTGLIAEISVEFEKASNTYRLELRNSDGYIIMHVTKNGYLFVATKEEQIVS